MTGQKFERLYSQDRDTQERVKAALGIMLPYQRRFIEDRSSGNVWEASRQIGKSFALTFKAILKTALSPRPIESVYGSASARQVFRSGREMRRHIKALSLLTEGKLAPDKNNAWLIAFPGDRFLNLVPSNPDTIPGFSGDVYLDEFGLHKDDWGIWRAAVPAITRGYGVSVASTHRGTKTKFYALCHNKAYSHHRTTIHDAIREGLLLKDEEGNVRTVESLRDLVADPLVWLEEYELEPQDDATAWLTWELIRAAEDEYIDVSPEWTTKLVALAVKAHKHFKLTKSDPSWWDTKSKELTAHLAGIGDPLDLGFDVGRTRDLSVIWLLRRGELARFSIAVIALARMPFRVQRYVLHALLPHVMRSGGRACIDCNGIGRQLAEEAADEFGSRVEGVNFTNANKEALAVGLKDTMEDYGLLIPIDPDVSRSLHSIQKTKTSTGLSRFDAERSDATGHADHFWAAALAVHAGEAPSVGLTASAVTSRGRRETSDLLEHY